ncbi:MAG: Sapep family Mn(2+)-dependent dipeptidase [Angelakisella sp.]
MKSSIDAAIDRYLAEHRAAIVEDLKTLVSIPSVSGHAEGAFPFGKGCAAVLDAALAMAEKKGLQVSNHGYYYGLAECGEGDKTIGIFSHLDVVPEGNGWVYSPYRPVEQEGCLIGRGVADNKSAAVAGVYVMDFLRRSELALSSRIRLYFGCSEETGMDDIAHFVAEQPMPDFSIVPDTDFPVCHGEKGILEMEFCCDTPFSRILEFSGGLVSNMVPDSARAVLVCRANEAEELKALAAGNGAISVRLRDGSAEVVMAGKSSHAAHPDGSVNAVQQLAAFLSAATLLPESDREILSFASRTLADTTGEVISIAASDAPSGALTCISGVASLIHGALKLNFNIRYPVTDKGERVIAGMCGYFAAAGWSERFCSDSAPAYLPKDDPMVQQLCRCYSEITGRDSTPYVMGGGTYARKLKNAIGFGMESDRKLPLKLPEGHGGVHQPDEAIFLDDILEAIKIYILSMVEIDRILNK